MKVKDIMAKNVVSVAPEESLTVALNKMKTSKINQLPVMDGKKYVGMLSLKTIVTKNIDPAQAKAGNFATSTPSVKSSDDVETAVQTMINTGLRALPVIDDRVVGIFSETDVVTSLEKISRRLMDLPIANVATKCEYVTSTDTAGKVKKIMMYNNVSRVPVVDGDKVVGVVGMIDMIKAVEGKKNMPSRGGRTLEQGAKEKLSIENVSVSNFIHEPTIVDKGARLGDVIKSFERFDEAIIIDGGVKIVTPKDIIELLLSASKEQVHVDIIGMKDEGPQITAKVDKSVSDFLRRMEKTVERVQYLFIHVERSHRGGKKNLYCIRTRFGTPIGMFVAKAEGWDPLAAVQEVLDALQKEVEHKVGRAHEARKKSRILKKRR